VALETAAASKLNAMEKWEDVQGLPSSVLEQNHDLIQQQIKSGVKSYKFSLPYGSVPMVDRSTGALKMVESYEHTKLHDTHDYLLPTEAAKEMAIQAWMEARRASRYTTDYVSVGGRSKQTKLTPRREYTGASHIAKHVNPFKSLLDRMSDNHGIVQSALVKEATSRFMDEQMERIRRAPTFSDALKEALPTGNVSGTGDAHSSNRSHVKYPKKALTMLWAKARHFGVLADKMPMHEPKSDRGYSLHNDYAFSNSGDKSVHGALMAMARDSGHEDLVSAMAQSAVRHKVEPSARETAEVLHHGFGHSAGKVRELKAAVERAGLSDHKKAAARFPSGGMLSNDNQWSPDANKKIGDILDERLAQEERKEVA
jgi:hypothetical protein